MFDFRYHIASLAAVFLALVLGILIGVAISGRGFVDKAERKQLNARIADLRRSRDTEKARADALQARQQASDEFVTQAYPLLMKDRLRGKKVALLVLGASGGDIGAAVDDTLADSGATQLRYRALKVPVDVVSIRRALASRPALRAFAVLFSGSTRGEFGIKDGAAALPTIPPVG